MATMAGVTEETTVAMETITAGDIRGIQRKAGSLPQVAECMRVCHLFLLVAYNETTHMFLCHFFFLCICPLSKQCILNTYRLLHLAYYNHKWHVIILLLHSDIITSL